VAHLFKDADVVFGNLECTLFRDGSPLRPLTGPRLHSSPDHVLPALDYLNFNVLSLGNNHIDDFGGQAIARTKSLLAGRGIQAFGAGSDRADAGMPSIITAGERKIGFLGYTTNTDSDGISPDIGSAIATPSQAGCNYYALPDIRNDIEQLKASVDTICVSMHWGHECYRYPSPGQIELAHAVVDAGADLIIGHHPHCYQGMETYKGGTILYSLGNFFFWNYLKRQGYPTWCGDFVVAICDLGPDGIKVEMVPGHMDKRNVLRLERDRQAFDRDFREYSERITAPGYAEFWTEMSGKMPAVLQEIRDLHRPGLIRSPADILNILQKIDVLGPGHVLRKALQRLKGR
jgi:poly-gamma-glutamate capsule biosynthesis protein CapA/YwtB (metallophosphatase superfamily)